MGVLDDLLQTLRTPGSPSAPGGPTTPTVTRPALATADQVAAAIQDREAASGPLAGVDGVVVLDLSTVRPGRPHVVDVGNGPLPPWCATRHRGVRWACGWWTDAGPLHPTWAQPPAGTQAATHALPGQAAGHWAVLHGQIVGDWAWALAIGDHGEVAGAFHTPTHRRQRLLTALGADEAGPWPEMPWSLWPGGAFLVQAAA